MEEKWLPGARIVFRVPTTSHKVARLAAAVQRLQVLAAEKRFMRIFVQPLFRENLGENWPGSPELYLSPDVFAGRVKYTEYMPVFSRPDISLLLYVLAHEWGHSTDRRSDKVAKQQRYACPGRGLVPKAWSDEHEDYAWAWTEWYLSKGRTNNAAARWYALHNEWRRQW